MSKLEDAGYVDVQKGFVGKRPRTVLRITTKGQRALEEYVANMKRLLEEVPVRKAGRARRAKLVPARA